MEINLSSVKGSGFEILINWLSALAVVGNSWANFFIKKSEASLNSSGERWQKQFLSGWRGQIQDLYSCASFSNTNTKLRKHLYNLYHVSLGTSHIWQRIVISCDMGHVILMLSHIILMFRQRLSVTNVRLATWCGIIWISHPPPPYPLPTPSNMPPFSTGTFSCLETSWRWSFRIIRLNSKFERHKYMHSVACF